MGSNVYLRHSNRFTTQNGTYRGGGLFTSTWFTIGSSIINELFHQFGVALFSKTVPPSGLM